jgi:hypothetical protein
MDQRIIQRRISAAGAVFGFVGFLVASIWMACGARHAQISGQPMLIREALYEGSKLTRAAEYMTAGSAYVFAIVFMLLSIFSLVMAWRAFRQ